VPLLTYFLRPLLFVISMDWGCFQTLFGCCCIEVPDLDCSLFGLFRLFVAEARYGTFFFPEFFKLKVFVLEYGFFVFLFLGIAFLNLSDVGFPQSHRWPLFPRLFLSTSRASSPAAFAQSIFFPCVFFFSP